MFSHRLIGHEFNVVGLLDLIKLRLIKLKFLKVRRPNLAPSNKSVFISSFYLYYIYGLSLIRSRAVTKMKKVVSPLILLFVVLLFKGIQLCVCTNSTSGWIEGQKQTLFKLEHSFKEQSNRLVSISFIKFPSFESKT